MIGADRPPDKPPRCAHTDKTTAMFQQLATIAHNTFTEAIRQPIFVVLILLGSLAMVINPQLAAYTMEDDNKLLIDMGLSTIFLVSLLLAAFTATGVFSNEIENKTVLTVVSKPVGRPLFVIGKYLGVVAAIAVAFFLLSLVLALTIRHRVMSTASDHFDMPVILLGLGGALVALAVATGANYLYNRVFTSTFTVCLLVTQTVAFALVLVIDKGWNLQSPVTDFVANGGELAQVAVGLGLVFQAVLVLSGVAIAASTRLGQVMTLLICVGVFLLGLVSNSLSQLVNTRLSIPAGTDYYQSLSAIFHADIMLHQKAVYTAAKLLYMLMPNLQFFWPADAITQDTPITAGLFGMVSAYAALQVVAVIAIAIALFQNREVG
jgi:ABC-type transport system involved in multi-copper enzyme maturation permease subunit